VAEPLARRRDPLEKKVLPKLAEPDPLLATLRERAMASRQGRERNYSRSLSLWKRKIARSRTYQIRRPGGGAQASRRKR